MTIQEMHYEFKLGLDKIDSLGLPGFTTKEIDAILNDAMHLFIEQRSGGNNPRRTGVEEEQKRMDDLRNITKNYNVDLTTVVTTLDNKPYGIFVDLPVDYRRALNEEATVEGLDCFGKPETIRGEVKAKTHNVYNVVKEDPFKAPYEREIIRLPYEGNTFELIGGKNTSFVTYHLRYLRNPLPLDFGTGQGCELAEHTHREIVRIAITRTLGDIESQRIQTQMIHESKQE